MREATPVTVTREISPESPALRGTGGASLAGVCHQRQDSIGRCDTASAQTWRAALCLLTPMCYLL